MNTPALIPLAVVATSLVYAAILYALSRRKPRCPALLSQQRCSLKEDHHGPHYARWQTGSIWRPIEEAHWNDPEPELTRDERLALEDLRVARELASFDQQLRHKPPPTGKPLGPRKLPS